VCYTNVTSKQYISSRFIKIEFNVHLLSHIGPMEAKLNEGGDNKNANWKG